MQERHSGAVFARFCVLQGAYWSFYASLLGYIGAYMLHLGVSASTLGMILALNLLSAFLGALFWGHWIDRRQASRAYYLIGNASALVLGLAMYRFAGRPALMAALYAAFGFMAGPIPTALDAWVIASFPSRRDAAGRTRSFATLSYAFVMLLMGQLIARLGYGVMPYAVVLFLGVSIIVARMQPAGGAPSSRIENVRINPKSLLASKRYILLVAAMFFTGMATAPINSMKAVVLEGVGGDVGILGWDAFIGCVIQAQFLIFSGRLLGISSNKRLLLGAIAPLFYALSVALARTPGVIIFGTIMNNVSFGILYPTMREVTEASVDPALRNTAHSVVDVAYGSLSGMIATSFSGAILEHAGALALGGVCAALQLIALALCATMARKGRAKRK